MADDAGDFPTNTAAEAREGELLPLLEVGMRRFASAAAGSREAHLAAETMLKTAVCIYAEHVDEAAALMTAAEMVVTRSQADRAAAQVAMLR